MKRAMAFAPATIANVAVGFDILGFAIAELGETAIVTKIENSKENSNTVTIEPIAGFPEIPLDPQKNTATAGLLRLQKDLDLPFGFHVQLRKQIPVGSGLGGSSTSAVATLVAANSLLKKKLNQEQLLDYALTGEAVASGARHGDNVGPCLHGGLVFVQAGKQLQVVKINTPPLLRCVVLLPKLSIRTEEARALLSPQVQLQSMVQQTSNLAGFLLGCMQNDFELLSNSLNDVVIEPQRSKLIPGFSQLQQTALEAGALGFSISGSGPAMFALTRGPLVAKKVQQKLDEKCKSMNLPIVGCWNLKISNQGARLVKK